jgi:outer membrane lipoprotein SlyB
MQKILLLALALSVAACGRNMDSTTYTSNSPVAKVVYGTVISARQVTVKDAERMQDNALGGLAGGVAGGVAGSGIGGGTGKGLATVGGAILGAVAGAAIQDELGTSTGTEYIVQLDSPKATGTKTIRSKERLEINRGSSVADDINDAIQVADTQSEAIAVVQKDEVVIAPGTRVAVIYADDRPRIAPLR